MDLQLGLFPDEPPPPEPAPVGPAPRSAELKELARRIPPTVRMGTSSWSFPGWEGIVWDRKASQAMLARDGLDAYARHPLLRAVGVDRTYYRSIGADDFRAYADAVPADFRFLVKADRLLTSPTDPEASGVRESNPRFLDPVYAVEEVVGPMRDGLGCRMGPLLFQFSPIPPNLVGGAGAFFDRLFRFLTALPEGPLYAVELRTPSFLNDRYRELLEATGAAHCYNVHPSMAPLSRQLELVSPFYQPALVVRWMLHAGLKYEVAKDRYAPFDRIVDEDVPSRELIATAVLDAAVAERPAFVIVNNKAEGSAPLSVRRLAERLADWTAPPSDAPPFTGAPHPSPGEADAP
jgi:uncharacterized protein YecE (DUF72 family)